MIFFLDELLVSAAEKEEKGDHDYDLTTSKTRRKGKNFFLHSLIHFVKLRLGSVSFLSFVQAILQQAGLLSLWLRKMLQILYVLRRTLTVSFMSTNPVYPERIIQCWCGRWSEPKWRWWPQTGMPGKYVDAFSFVCSIQEKEETTTTCVCAMDGDIY